MSLKYNIWGIDDTGFKPSITSNLDPNTLLVLKETFSDKNRTFALDFASSNPTKDNFYSIEKRGGHVLYTIYRTNWYRGSRLSYDAATIISSTNIENPITALKALMREYISKKESGFKNFDLDHILKTIKASINNLPSNRNNKNGFIKYNSETELISIFQNSKESIKNFNKVYFFTSLPYLETGIGKIQNLKDYKEISISVTNFNAKHHKITINGITINKLYETDRQSFNCYAGDEIVSWVKGIKKNVKITKVGMSIHFDKIMVPKIVQKSSIKKNVSSIKRNRNKKKQEKTIVLGIITVLLVVIGVFFIYDFSGSGGGDKDGANNTPNCKIELINGEFKDKANEQEITDSKKLLECFKVRWIKIKGVKYTLLENKINKIPEDEGEVGSITEKSELLKLITDLDTAKEVTKEVISAINKIIHYNDLISENGLEGKKYIWFWKDNELKYIKKSSIRENKSSKNKSINEKFLKNNIVIITDFLQEKIPTSIMDEIKNFLQNFEVEVKKKKKKKKEIIETVEVEEVEIINEEEPEVKNEDTPIEKKGQCTVNRAFSTCKEATKKLNNLLIQIQQTLDPEELNTLKDEWESYKSLSETYLSEAKSCEINCNKCRKSINKLNNIKPKSW